MVKEKEYKRRLLREALLRRHMHRAHAYVEAKKLIRDMATRDLPWMRVSFKPIHYYMHLLPGFNTHFIAAKYVGWRRTRAVDIYPDPDNVGFVRVELNVNYLAKREN